MLNLLDHLVRTLLLERVGLLAIGGPSTEEQVRFDPPDGAWRTYVTNNLHRNALSVYLVDVQENRKLRSNEVFRRTSGQIVSELPAPARLDCHYLISAQTPAVSSETIEPVLDEHSLLYEVASALLLAAPLRPAEIYAGTSDALNAWPEDVRFTDLPTQVAPPDGFPKLHEFWMSMGSDQRWKPVVHLIVTLPVLAPARIAGPQVTTRIATYGLPGGADEQWIEIGGAVSRAGNPVGSGHAVEIEAVLGGIRGATETNDNGRFQIARLAAGQYHLRVRDQAGRLQLDRVVEIPSPGGGYDVDLL